MSEQFWGRDSAGMKFQGDSAKLKILEFIGRCLSGTCVENYTLLENQIFSDFWKSKFKIVLKSQSQDMIFIFLCPQSIVTRWSFSKFTENQDSDYFKPFIYLWCMNGLFITALFYSCPMPASHKSIPIILLSDKCSWRGYALCLAKRLRDLVWRRQFVVRFGSPQWSKQTP